MFDLVIKLVVLAAATVAYLAYVLFHVRYSFDVRDTPRATRLTAGNITLTLLFAACAVLAFALRSGGLVTAGLFAMTIGYLNFRYGANSMMADALDKPAFFLSSGRTSAWFLFSVIVILLGLVALLVERFIYAPVGAVGLVIVHLVANSVSGINVTNKQASLVQTLVWSYVSARKQVADGANEEEALVIALDLATQKVSARSRGGLGEFAEHADYLKEQVLTGKLRDIKELAGLALAITYPDRSYQLTGDFMRSMTEHERREKLVDSILDTAGIPTRLRGEKHGVGKQESS